MNPWIVCVELREAVMDEVPGATVTTAPHAPSQKPKNPAKPKSEKQKLETAPLMNVEFVWIPVAAQSTI